MSDVYLSFFSVNEHFYWLIFTNQSVVESYTTLVYNYDWFLDVKWDWWSKKSNWTRYVLITIIFLKNNITINKIIFTNPTGFLIGLIWIFHVATDDEWGSAA